jgi:hypothetical protein
MTQEPIEESKTNTKTERFAQWLMTREERRAEKDTNIEGLIKLNLIASFLTLAMVGGFEAVRTALALVPYLFRTRTFAMVPLEFDHGDELANCTLNFNRLHCQPIHVSIASAIRSSAFIERQDVQTHSSS